MDKSNPYQDLERRELEELLLKNNTEWVQVCQQRAEIDQRTQELQLRRSMILDVLGVKTVPVDHTITTQLVLNFRSRADDVLHEE